ncbi:MAG TPA: amino acid adenylation domain-containing protein [Sporichthyaceae bacterium]|jgi:amino acid adenylation domain-containing protein/thioester reductase-like protein|nr:amino acid adenylation domain-containing protein [Sporichthyaceae bacterium]
MQEFGDPDSGGILSPPGGGCLHEAFDAVAALLGNAVAGVDHGRTITFAQLKVLSDRLARRLYEAGVSPGDRVGVCGGRSLDALVAFLGILKAGAAYLPLDDTSPPRRLQAMAEEAGVQTVVTLPGSVARVRRIRTSVELPTDGGGGVGDPPLRTAVTDQDCAYVMFTSGSTGRPKAVAVPHRGVVALAASDAVHQRPRPTDRVLHGYNLSSDASTIEIWPALLAGACIVIANREELLSPTALEQRFVEDEVTVAYLTTSVFHHVARVKPEALRRLRFASAGGESMDPALARAITDACPGTTVVNFYGPTENSVVSTAYIVMPDREPRSPMPIGRPLEYATCHIVRPDGTAVADGEEGELLVGGTGLALGYIGDPDLTARKFVPHPTESDLVVYRTGDRVVRNAEGDLEYRGRIDRQIKLRGHRIELEEIEARLRADDRIGEAIVDFDGHSLTGYVTPATPGTPIPTDAVRADLAKWLPAPAALQKLIEVPRLPVSAAGKVDRKLLSQLIGPETTSAPGPALAAAPVVGGLLGTLAQIWQNFLRVWPGEDDDFFAVGGDSLLAAQVVTSTCSTLGIDAKHGTSLVRCLLNTPTLKGFAAAVSAVNDGATLAQTPDVDFATEARYGSRLPEPAAVLAHPFDPRHVLLTGASGFVGAWLLYSLMNRTDAVVHCPVRASSEAHAGQRIRSNLARYGLERAWDPERIRCFPGDLAAAELAEPLARLEDKLDLVIHSAAQVNFLYPYEALRQANVEATRKLIQLAAPRRAPVHFLSTIATVAGFGLAGVHHVTEEMPLAHPELLTMGYGESKWVAEEVLRDAARQGMPVAIYRPYEIMGDQLTGASNTETAICSLFKYIADTGSAPDIALPLDLVPVDYLSDAIVHIATTCESTDRTYHLTNPNPASLTDMLDCMRAAGHLIQQVPYQDWVIDLVEYVSRHPDAPTAPFVPLCVDRAKIGDMSVKEMYFEGTFPTLGRDNVERDLADAKLTCPPADTALLNLYLNHFHAAGYITVPRRVA